MSLERESLEGLENQINQAQAGIDRARNYMARVGVTDVAPHLKLDPSDISQFSQRRPIVREINRRLVENAIPILQARIDDVSVELVKGIDEQSAFVKEELEATRADVEAGFLASSVLDRLREVARGLQSKRDSFSYRHGREIISLRQQKQQATPVGPTQPEAPMVPVAPIAGPSIPETPPDLSEKERQIELIRQNLGNPDAFEFPAGMTTRELFDQDIEDGKAYAALYNVLARSDIRSVEALLSMFVEDLVGRYNEKSSGVRGFGIKKLEITLERLLQKGILLKTLVPQEFEEVVSAEPVGVEQSIADIQRLVSEGRLVDPTLLEKAQEVARQFGGTIELQRPLTLPDGQDAEDIRGRRGKELLEILIAAYKKGELETSGTIEIARRIWGEGIDIKLGKDRLSLILGRIKGQIEQRGWTILNDNPKRSGRKRDDQWGLYRLAKISEPAEKKPEPAVGEKEKATLSHRENRELALDAILKGIPELTPQEILDLFGRQRNGRSFTWPAAKSSMINHLLQVSARVGRGTAGEKDRQLQDRTYRFMGKTDDQDFREVIREFEWRLVAWFKGEAPLTNTPTPKLTVVTGPVVESEAQPLGLTVEQPPAPKLTERQAKREEMITERVRGILAEINQIENLPDSMGSSRLTWLAKHHLGLTITDTDIQKFIDRGYIEQFPGDGHHPSYNQKSLLTATYLRRFGNNMSKAQRRKLLKIISSEFSAWQAQRSNQ